MVPMRFPLPAPEDSVAALALACIAAGTAINFGVGYGLIVLGVLGLALAMMAARRPPRQPGR